MRIHTNNPAGVWQSIWDATRNMPGVYADLTEHGSRTRGEAIELKLEGTSNRKVNAGTSRNVDRFDLPNAATWDEWGVVLQAVFDADPNALAGSAKYPVYDGREDYERQTQGRFVTAHDGVYRLPHDTHQNHVWDYKPGQATTPCKRCSAEKTR